MPIVGIYVFLYALPIWATALILYALTDLAMHIGRERYEGLGYQVAYSAKVGDAGLLIAVLIAAGILQRGEVRLSAIFLDGRFHLLLLAALFIIGAFVAVLTGGSRGSQMMDIYHDVVIAPLFAYFAVTLLPVIYIGGTGFEKAATIFLILLWAVLGIYDVKAKRMNQRDWLWRELKIKLR